MISQALGVSEKVYGVEGRRRHATHRQVPGLLPASNAIAHRLPSQSQGENCEGEAYLAGSRKRMLAAVFGGKSEGDQERHGHRESRYSETKEPILFEIGAARRQRAIHKHIQENCCQRRNDTGDEHAVFGQFGH